MAGFCASHAKNVLESIGKARSKRYEMERMEVARTAQFTAGSVQRDGCRLKRRTVSIGATNQVRPTLPPVDVSRCGVAKIASL